ncbi:MAG TPA: glycosyltransferase, partial [Thermoanaerobaculia bacterium]|nr:glycosyltransferase [Thermoanaerobaculia bacterium]
VPRLASLARNDTGDNRRPIGNSRQPNANRPPILILRPPDRRGFAGNANRALRASTRDAVLLNSDTIVTRGWLEKLIDAAYSHGDVGTVTPLSNNATLASVPRAFEENLLPAGHDLASFAALVERVSPRARPRVPTGVGFCLYLRRALLDDIGFFDESRFGLGYGEENDLCLRALARGWLHILDDATFVFHAGHRSFGAARGVEERKGRRRMARAHPRYFATIADFMRRDPLAPVRARIAAASGGSASADLRLVHLVHGWPPFQHAGTELYASWLAHQQRARHHVAVYARLDDRSRAEGEAVELDDRGIRVRLVTNNFSVRDPLQRNALRNRAIERDFARFLRDERPDLLHIHHLAGHAFSLARVARRLGIPIVMQIQDWWPLCARVNLLDRHGRRCSGPSPSKCASCATLTRVPPARLTNRALHAMRRGSAREALFSADVFIAGSRAIRDDFAPIVPRSTPFHVLPYGIAVEESRTPRAAVRKPVRFGYVGTIAPHKGVHVAAAAAGAAGGAATLHVWGDAGALPEYAASLAGANVVLEGTFTEEEKPRVYASMDVLLVPSIGLESFGLAAREAMACGVPVIATEGGALADLFAEGLCGELVPPGDVDALAAVLRRVAEDPSIVDRWRAQLPRPKRVDEHAREIESVYRTLLAERRR